MSKQLLILGGGFGLYGYLPAALKANWQVSTLERYRNFLNNRTELVDLVNQISFVEEDNLDLDIYDGIVIARNPIEQLKFVKQASGFKGHYFLEKPIGATLDSSLELLEILETRASSFSIGYLLRYQDWYKKILTNSSGDFNLSINWKIPRLQSTSWKNDEELGGGLLSYYGIHLLVLIAELNSEIESLQIIHKPDILRIDSTQSSKVFKIELTAASSPAFEINLSCPSHDYLWSGMSPFGSTPNAGLPDPRIPALAQYLSESREQKDSKKLLLLERRIQELRETISEVL
jgi:hypothetical protein